MQLFILLFDISLALFTEKILCAVLEYGVMLVIFRKVVVRFERVKAFENLVGQCGLLSVGRAQYTVQKECHWQHGIFLKFDFSFDLSKLRVILMKFQMWNKNFKVYRDDKRTSLIRKQTKVEDI